jgi:hypothetical protein
MDGFSKTYEGRRYFSRGLIARRRYQRHPRTLKRWEKDPEVNFPPPDLEINGHGYYSEPTLDAFEAARKAKNAT